MKRSIFLVFLVLIWIRPALAEDIGNGNLVVTLAAVGQGMELAGIQKQNSQLLDGPSSLFSLVVQRLSDQALFTIRSTDNWTKITPSNDGTTCTLIFTDPADADLPDSLQVSVTIVVSGDRSRWGLKVTGTGSGYSLIEVTFPEIHIKAEGNDQFLIPKYSGTLIPDPVTAGMDRELYYPRGWGATMQFLAYYNDNYGIYLGYHDPGAALKYFFIKAENGHLNFRGTMPVADKTRPGNDWSMDGHFELDLFNGNWYEAALIYRDWASQEADYWPKMTPERVSRQGELGRIGVWGYYSAAPATSMDTIKNDISSFRDYYQAHLNIPVGIHWYRWNGRDFDDDYPDYFPERQGMDALVNEIQQNGNTYIMPYINGRLYDTDLTDTWDYQTKGKPYATKKSDATVYTQTFNNNLFAVMCPTQAPWQDILVDAAAQLINRIGCRGIYIDQVSAAGPTECMDPGHGHPLGGGHWWRDGYREMFTKIRNSIAPGRFVLVEGGADYMADQVDGFLTDGWLTDNLVPAFQVIYAGRVQLIGKRTGTSRYNNQSFYCKLSQALVHAIEPGRFSLWIVHDDDAEQKARPFTRRIATMRYKLRDFLSFGTMLKPLPIQGNIPQITSSWTDYGTAVDVTIPAVQTGIYQDRSKKNIALLFANASMQDTLTFSFQFDGRKYGCTTEVTIQELRETTDGVPQKSSCSFSRQVTLAPLDMVAFIVSNQRHFPWPMYLQILTRQTL